MTTLNVHIEGVEDLRRSLARMNPKQRTSIVRNSMVTCAKLVQSNVQDVQIVAGGRGKGKYTKPLPHQLTSREGTLRRSIAINRSPLPFSIEIGTALEYGPVHEFGGRVSVPASTVRAHTRTIAFGKKVKPFEVPSYRRSAYTASYPPRPFLKPGRNATAPRFPAVFVAEWKKEIRR